jgi:hypothetical protein
VLLCTGVTELHGKAFPMSGRYVLDMGQYDEWMSGIMNIINIE